MLVDGRVYRKLRHAAADIAAGTSLLQLRNDVAYHQLTQTAGDLLLQDSDKNCVLWGLLPIGMYRKIPVLL